MDGNITLLGEGGSSAGVGVNDGIRALPVSSITTSGTGNISITGTAGSNGSINYGINTQSLTIQTTGSGNINATGTGTFGRGFNMSLGSLVETTGSGSIMFTGTGTAPIQPGLLIFGPIRTTGTGSLTINSDHVRALDLVSSAGPLKYTVTGTVSLDLGGSTITTAGGPSTISVGTLIAGNADISNTGTNSLTFTSQNNLLLVGTSIVTTGSGPLTVQAPSIDLGTSTIGSVLSSAPIIVETNSITFATGSIRSDQAGGTVTIQTVNPSDSIGLGTSLGTLMITNPELTQIVAGSGVTFGRTNQQVINVGATFPYPSTTLRANMINVDSPTSTGANPLNFIIGLNNFWILNIGSTLTASNIQITGSGIAANNRIVAGLNSTNTWNISSDNAGTLVTDTPFTVNFTNVGNLFGGNMDDTFIFSDQQGVAGMIDGGTPPITNTLDYTAFSTPALVESLGPFDGIASNIPGGFLNICCIIGNFTVPITGAAVIPTVCTQIDLALVSDDIFFKGKNDELFHLFQFYLLSKAMAYPNAFWSSFQTQVIFQRTLTKWVGSNKPMGK